MQTTFMPAALAAMSPEGESSNTRHWQGSTPSCLAQAKKISGEGLLWVISSPQTMT
ncbi:uncharacterized protein METZ01_LOCUS334012 [marine metagenome]|uniref:Uncharacterized protein n=1 Tax=marine metagenome TaxID=408172 RepID=A0A382Q8A2_9ZZZZ